MAAVRVSNHPLGVNSTGTLPPLSIRGVTMREAARTGSVSVSLDWLRYSVSWPSEFVRDGVLVSNSLSELSQIAFKASVMPFSGLKLSGEVLPPPKGYNARMGLSCGSLRFHSDIPGQKIGVEFTGRELGVLRGMGADPLEMLRWMGSVKGVKVTRLDLAVDYFGEADPLDLNRAFLEGKLITPARQVVPHNGKVKQGREFIDIDRGVYIGSRSSDRFLRVYDKRLEQGGSGEPWVRIELQLGGDRADRMAQLLGADPRAFQDVARAAIREFCEAPSVPWFGAALTGPVVELPQLGRKDSDRKAWLLHQVLPAFRAELADCDELRDWELRDAFESALAPYLAQYLDTKKRGEI